MTDFARDQELLRQKALGWSIACEEILPGFDLGRDIRLQTGPGGLDFALVDEMDTLSQSLTLALTTRLGDDIFNTLFGFDGLNALAEETDPVMTRERVRISIIQILRKEPRVRRILDVNFADDARLQAPAAGSRELDVRVVFETVTGDTASLALGKVSPNG